MNPILTFSLEVILTIFSALLVVGYIRPHLHRILVDLCGTEERAQFWTVFSNILLIGFPALIAFTYQPEAQTPEGLFFEMISRLSGNLIGLLIALIGTGVFVAFFALVAPKNNKVETK
jgi:hypothetical protein